MTTFTVRTVTKLAPRSLQKKISAHICARSRYYLHSYIKYRHTLYCHWICSNADHTPQLQRHRRYKSAHRLSSIFSVLNILQFFTVTHWQKLYRRTSVVYHRSHSCNQGIRTDGMDTTAHQNLYSLVFLVSAQKVTEKDLTNDLLLPSPFWILTFPQSSNPITSFFTSSHPSRMWPIVILGEKDFRKAFLCYEQNLVLRFLQNSTCFQCTSVTSFTYSLPDRHFGTAASDQEIMK